MTGKKILSGMETLGSPMDWGKNDRKKSTFLRSCWGGTDEPRAKKDTQRFTIHSRRDGHKMGSDAKSFIVVRNDMGKSNSPQPTQPSLLVSHDPHY